jgi:hypothetical protein
MKFFLQDRPSTLTMRDLLNAAIDVAKVCTLFFKKVLCRENDLDFFGHVGIDFFENKSLII